MGLHCPVPNITGSIEGWRLSKSDCLIFGAETHLTGSTLTPMLSRTLRRKQSPA